MQPKRPRSRLKKLRQRWTPRVQWVRVLEHDDLKRGKWAMPSGGLTAHINCDNNHTPCDMQRNTMLTSKYVANWEERAARFETWWARERTDRPLIRVNAKRDKPLGDAPEVPNPGPPDRFLDTDFLVALHRRIFQTTYYGGDGFPSVIANLGPGSLALYLGSEPGFAETTVWFKPCIDSLADTPLPEFDPKNKWFVKHLDIVRAMREAFGEDAWVGIPDLVESLDILAAMRDPMRFLYDLMDRPADVHRWLRRINDLYMPHYDAFYNIAKHTQGDSAFTAFDIWGPGKTAKVQCDFAAMVSPDQFAEFYIPYVTEQVSQLDRSLYHLDGPDCIRHVPHLLGVENLHAIQWTCGAGNPEGGDPHWYPLMEQILGGGKGVQVTMSAENVEPFLRRFGPDGVYIRTAVETQREADELVAMTKRVCGRV